MMSIGFIAQIIGGIGRYWYRLVKTDTDTDADADIDFDRRICAMMGEISDEVIQ